MPLLLLSNDTDFAESFGAAELSLGSLTISWYPDFNPSKDASDQLLSELRRLFSVLSLRERPLTLEICGARPSCLPILLEILQIVRSLSPTLILHELALDNPLLLDGLLDEAGAWLQPIRRLKIVATDDRWNLHIEALCTLSGVGPLGDVSFRSQVFHWTFHKQKMARPRAICSGT